MYNYSYCDPRMDYRLAGDIAEYIKDEMTDSRYYTLLAQQAPTKRASDLLMEFSRDEWNHAQQLNYAYTMLTGTALPQPTIVDPVIPVYNEALKERLLAETSDYRKYGEKYLIACNPGLKDMFYRLRTDEGVHAMRMPLLMMGG